MPPGVEGAKRFLASHAAAPYKSPPMSLDSPPPHHPATVQTASTEAKDLSELSPSQ